MIKYILFPIFIISVHWLAVRFYSTHCVPDNLMGYITTYLTAANPVCSYVVKIIDKTSSIYTCVFLTMSMWTINAFVMCFKDLFSLNQSSPHS